MEGLREAPQQPEALTLLRKLRRFGTGFYWSGGYANQPHVLMMELHEVIEAEIEHKNILLENQLLQAEAKANAT